MATDTQDPPSTGVTDAERYLHRLTQRTFLRLWSHPAIYRNQGGGKEICDAFVVFDEHIIIFSDKDCIFPDTGNLPLDWSRWFRRAIQKSAEQAWGAERWIRSFPERIFAGRDCLRRFPLPLPDVDRAIFHLVIVAHQSQERCTRERGGVGSLRIDSAVTDFAAVPFSVGDLDPSQTFVHVLDDRALAIVLRTQDTIADFVQYLAKKEQLLRSGRHVVADGEEDLLAWYATHLDGPEEHGFNVPTADASFVVPSGEWTKFERHPQRLAKIEADADSYAWDRLIDVFAEHALNDTQYHKPPGGLQDTELILRFMARLNRYQRRILADSLAHVLFDDDFTDRRTRFHPPAKPGDAYFIFQILRRGNLEYEEYRSRRIDLLRATCLVAKLQNPDALDIVVIGMETATDVSHTEDAVYMDGRKWSPHDEELARGLQANLEMLTNPRWRAVPVEPEYPVLDKPRISIPKGVRIGRNEPCPCGSGLKFKRCHGR